EPEAALLELDVVGEAAQLGADDLVADQFAQVALAGDVADDRDGPLRVGAFDELGELLTLALDEVEVADGGGQPEDQLVEEQDDGVVAEGLGVGADGGEAVVEVDEAFACGAGLGGGLAPEGADVGGGQLLPLGAGGAGGEGGIDSGGVPGGGVLAPVV